MYNKFIEYIEKENLFPDNAKILIAVSGGKDSMVLVDLLLKMGGDIGIAHFNHMTRRGESDRDQRFVEKFCKTKSIMFYTISVDINKMLNNKKGKNFQDLARTQRYGWLEKIRSENNYDFIVTAHHKNDNIETFLYKISRGSGVKGLVGIRAKNGFVVRPMLSISSEEISEYIEKHKIPFVEDSSNSSDDYNRNFIRHNIIPQFEELNSNFVNRISVTIDNLKKVDLQFDFLMDAYTAKYICRKRGQIIISKSVLERVPKKRDFLFFLLQKYGFNISQVQDMLNSIDRVGALFESDMFVLVIDRVSFVIKGKSSAESHEFSVVLGKNELEGNGVIEIEQIDNTDLKFGGRNFFIDASKVNFPMHLRNWRAGDVFKPFGLKGKGKKIKDYFTNLKMNRFDKENALVLLNGDEVCMVLGVEISYDYRVRETTKKILKVDYKPIFV